MIVFAISNISFCWSGVAFFIISLNSEIKYCSDVLDVPFKISPSVTSSIAQTSLNLFKLKCDKPRSTLLINATETSICSAKEKEESATGYRRR